LLSAVFLSGWVMPSSLDAGTCRNLLKAIISPLRSAYFWIPPAVVLVDGVEIFTKKRPLERKNFRNALVGIGVSTTFALAGNEYQNAKLTTEKNLFSEATALYVKALESGTQSNRKRPKVLEIVGIDPPIALRTVDPFRNQFLESMGVRGDEVSIAEYGHENPGKAKLTRWIQNDEKFSVIILRGHHAGNMNGVISLIPRANLTSAEEFSNVFMPYAAPDVLIVAATCEGLAGIKDQEAWQFIAKQHLNKYPSGSLTIVAATQVLHGNPFADFSSVQGKALNFLSPAIGPIRFGVVFGVVGMDSIPSTEQLTPNLPGNLRVIVFKNS